MRKLYVLFIAVTLLYSCQKDREQVDPTSCEWRMKEKFKEELKCTEQGVMEVNLFRGVYKNEQVYFTLTMCINCNTLPPTYGYTCEDKKVTFDDFGNVEDIKEIYNSCTQEFKNKGSIGGNVKTHS